jgi:ATP/ADP translocase
MLTKTVLSSVHLQNDAMRCIVQVVEHWTFSIFFCIAELWGSVVISVLFWTLANELCSVTDAKTIYPLMGISANMALVVAGNYVKWINRVVAQVTSPLMLTVCRLCHEVGQSRVEVSRLTFCLEVPVPIVRRLLHSMVNTSRGLDDNI